MFRTPHRYPVASVIPKASADPEDPVAARAARARSARNRPAHGAASRLQALLSLVPAALMLAVFFIGPVLWSAFLSMTDTALTGRAAAEPQLIGLENFGRFLGEDAAQAAVGRTLVYVVLVVAGQNVLGLALALAMRGRAASVRALVNAAVVSAWVMPEIVVAILWFAFLEPDGGTLNALATSLGLQGQDWLISMPMLAVVLASIWRGTAFSLIVYSAAIEEIPPELVEASQVDGANALQRLRFVVLPSIGRMIFSTLLLTTLQTLGVFGLIAAMTAGGPNDQTETLPVFMVREAFSFHLLGYGSAIALVLVGVGAVISLAYVLVFRVRERPS